MVDKKSPEERPDQDVKTDRRRPGRVEYSNPALIRIMRGTYDAALHEIQRIEDDQAGKPDAEDATEGRAPGRDDLRPARGIAFAAGLGAASWVVIGGAVWVLLRLL